MTESAGSTFETGSGTGLETWLHVALLLLLTVATFSNSLHGDYHLDDIYRVKDNPEVEILSPVTRHFTDPRTSATLPHLVQYRPLLPLSLSLNVAASRLLGLDERLVGYHLGNIAIHLIGVLLAYALFRELLTFWVTGGPGQQKGSWPPSRTAFFGALLFALNPVSGVPVNYICGRDLLMMQAFLLASLLVYVRMHRLGGGWWRWPVSLLLVCLSLLSKTNAVVAPALVLAFELVFARAGPLRERAWRRSFLHALIAVALFGLCAVGFFVVTELVIGFSDRDQLRPEKGSWWTYALTQLDLHFSHYLRNVFWPFRIRPLPFVERATSLFQPRVFAGALFVAASLVVAFRAWRRAPLIAFSILAYWILFLPTSSFRPLRILATDYRQYPSLAFLCLLIAFLVTRVFSTTRARVAVLGVLALWFGSTAFYNNNHWLTEESFWGRSVRYGGTALAHMNYGVSVRTRDPALAEKHFERTLELEPGHALGHINLGLLRIHMGREAEGLALVERAVDINPAWAISHHWLATAYLLVDRLDDAARSSWRATQLDPRVPEYRDQAIELLYKAAHEAQLARDVATSIPHLEKLHRLVESHRDSLFLEGYALQMSQRRDDAIERYERFTARQPTHVQAQFNLGYALMKAGRPCEAIERFMTVIELKPDYVEALQHLATCRRDC